MRTAFVYVADGGCRQFLYRQHAIVKLLRHVGKADVFTFTGGVNRVRGRQVDGETLIAVDDVFSDVYGKGKIDLRVGGRRGTAGFDFPALTFSRVLCPVVPELSGYDRFVYMDNDTEVVSTAFSGVETEQRLGEIAGAGDYPDKVGGYVDDIESRGGPRVSSESYVNTGVLVMTRPVDAGEWIGKCRAAWELEQKCGFLLGDQDAINCAFNVSRLPKKYNFLCRAPAEAPVGTALCHYAGGCKRHYLNRAAKETANGLV